jgi:hypothetical protein
MNRGLYQPHAREVFSMPVMGQLLVAYIAGQLKSNHMVRLIWECVGGTDDIPNSEY